MRWKAPAALSACLMLGGVLFAANTPVWVYENKYELVVNGDFDGDGRQDVALVDRPTGNYRIGYQLQEGKITWAMARPSRILYVTGLSAGHLLDPKKDALVFSSADGAVVHVVDAADLKVAGRMTVLKPDCLGPATVVAVDIGGAGNTPEADLYLNSIYNVDPVNLSTLYRNTGGTFKQIEEVEAPGALSGAQRVTLQDGGPEWVVAVVQGKEKSSLIFMSLASGKPEIASKADDLPGGAAFVMGRFSGNSLGALVYKPGEAALQYRPVEIAGGKPALGKATSFNLPRAVQQIFAAGQHLLVVHGTNDPAAIYAFDGTKAPVEALTIQPKPGEMVTGGFVAGQTIGALFRIEKSRFKYSTRYELYHQTAGKFSPAGGGELPPCEVTDAFLVPELHRLITSSLEVNDEAAMAPYTNNIPGTPVKYVMLPIKSGEFLMGSPATEKGRKPDESPQHKVKVDAFWMGKFEVTWNEYELFMYPDDEKKLRNDFPTNPERDRLSDQITRPSKPYVEMSFGMGKDGFPAIAMTQHGANKYCMWLSSKTGHYYRLPTEAEWEYACRAGTTTAYSFGDDETKLEEYAWFEKNSEEGGDWKYHKVGLKKPNPWGLHDMHGNVAEWCLDQYLPDYSARANGAVNPWVVATKPYPHVARGGSYDFEAAACRSAARIASTPDWKAQDPQLPKSVWYLTDAKFIGFRLVRPLKVPPPEVMEKTWISGVEKD